MKQLTRVRVAIQARACRTDKSKLSLFLRVFPVGFADKDFIVSSRIHVDANKWNAVTKQAKGSSLESQRVNSELRKLQDDVHSCFDSYVKTVKTPIMSRFKQYIDSAMFKKGETKSDIMNVSDLFEHYVDMNGHKLGYKRKLRYSRVKQMVDSYNVSIFSTTNVSLDSLSVEWWKGFEKHVTTSYNLMPSTIRGYLKVLKAAVNNAHATGKLVSNPFTFCKIPRVVERPRHLKPQELEKLKRFKTSNAALALTVDVFLFATYTGLSYSDLKSLKKSHIKLNAQGSYYIERIRVKTSVEYTAPIGKYAASILEKYRNDVRLEGTGLCLPVPNLNTYNKLLKLAAAYCQIDTVLSSHVARHTFATSVWLENGGSLEALKSILGHSKIETTERYGKMRNDRVFQEAIGVFG